jgi:stage II sporulation protein R
LKKVIIIALCILIIAGIFVACDGGSKPVSVHSGVIRLHILANSDTDADQSTKLKVRDLVLKDWGSKLMSLGTTAKAWAELNELLPAIQKDIAAYLKGLGAKYGAKLETGEYDFPKRDYNGVEFPEGKYKALRIELGAAAGHNWWCVMFPPLFLVGENGEMNMQDYMDLVKSLDEQGITPDTAPEAPVRSWLYDKFFGNKQWDKDFLEWAKEFLLGSEDK